MRLVGRKEAGFAGLHLERLARDFDMRAAFEQVAHLLDSRVCMRKRTLAALDLAQDEFKILGGKQPKVPCPGVIGRRIGLELGLADQVFDGGIQLWRAMPPSTRISAPVT